MNPEILETADAPALKIAQEMADIAQEMADIAVTRAMARDEHERLAGRLEDAVKRMAEFGDPDEDEAPKPKPKPKALTASVEDEDLEPF